MDVYDDDPIRKDAVQHENLVVIQAGKHACMQAGSVLPWLCFNFFLPGEPAFHPVDLCVSGAKPSQDMCCRHRMLRYERAVLHAGTAVAILSRRASFSSGCLPSYGFVSLAKAA